MDPTVIAAWIAAGISFLTLVGTLVAQYLGYRAASRDAEKTAGEQREQLERTFAEQREQLDRTLGEQRTRTFNERFATAADRLGRDRPPEVRLAGVYAMAGLADDWEENRQTCVDVLCAYLRMPYEPVPGSDAPEVQRLTFQAFREVRHTVIRVITAHLRDGSAATPSSAAARSASAVPGSAAAKSASTARGSPAGRSTSARSAIGRSRLNSRGRVHHHQA